MPSIDASPFRDGLQSEHQYFHRDNQKSLRVWRQFKGLNVHARGSEKSKYRSQQRALTAQVEDHDGLIESCISKKCDRKASGNSSQLQSQEFQK